jgi:predicted Zn-dependent peptidase
MIFTYNKTHSKLSTIVVAFRAGSRVESVGGFNSGIAHMLEHCIFKGTKNRESLQIQRDIAFLGGDINAYTSHEMVAYHITVPFENLDGAMEILSDIVFESTVPDEEFLKEKEVVKEEELSRLDSIGSFIWNEFSKEFFSNYIASPVIGTQSSIDKFTSEEVRDFYKKNCTKSDAVISICTNLPKKNINKLFLKYFGKNTGKIRRIGSFIDSEYKGAREKIIYRPGIEQTYVWVGTPGVSSGSKLEPSIKMMSTILGSGMDSRLFTEVRENRGLAYSVSSSSNEWSNGGLMLITSSTRNENVPEMLKVIDSEVERIKTELVTEEELQRAKNKIRTSFYSLIESSYGVAIRSSKEKLFNKMPLDDYIEALNSVSVNDIKVAANKVFDNSKKLTMICKKE